MVSLASMASRGSTPVLEQVIQFTQARHRVLVENIANIDTPGYRTKQLDAAGFRAELRRAAERRGTPAEPLPLRATNELQWDAAGHLTVAPSLEPAENAMFYDGTNARVERQMSALADNGQTHQLAVEMLKRSYDGLMTAIRGRP